MTSSASSPPFDPNRIRIFTWNVNGIRSLVNNGFFARLFDPKPIADIICLQESKVASLENIDKKVALLEGYESYWSFSKKKKGWSGVVTFARKGITRYAEEGFGDPRYNLEGRVVMTDHDSFVLFNVYVPNGQKGDVDNRLAYKLAFLRSFLGRIQALRRGEIDALGHPITPPKPREVIVVGDFNIVHWEEDLWRPRRLAGVTAFLNIERRLLCRWVRTYQLQPRQQSDGTLSAQYQEEEKALPKYGTPEQRAIAPTMYPPFLQRLKDLFDDSAETREAPFRILHQRMRDETPTRGRGASLDVGNNISGSGRRSIRDKSKSTFTIRTAFEIANEARTKRLKSDGVLAEDATTEPTDVNQQDVQNEDANSNATGPENEIDMEDVNGGDNEMDDTELELTDADLAQVSAAEIAVDDVARCPPGELPPDIRDVPLLDVFRSLRPCTRHTYTCWNVVRNYRPLNLGVRIDYIFATEGLTERAIKAEVLQGIFGSDHCPVLAEFSLAPREPLRRMLRVEPEGGKAIEESDSKHETILVGPPILSLTPEEAEAKNLWACEIPPLAHQVEAPRLCAKYDSKFNRKQMSLHGFFVKAGTSNANAIKEPVVSTTPMSSSTSAAVQAVKDTMDQNKASEQSKMRDEMSETKNEISKPNVATDTITTTDGKSSITNETSTNYSGSEMTASRTTSVPATRTSISPWEPISVGSELKSAGTTLGSKSAKGTLRGFVRK